MFEEELEAIEEIIRLKEKHKLSATQVFCLQILKLTELQGVNYVALRDYFIKNSSKDDILLDQIKPKP